jgi:tRNA(Ile)-lysidine synthase
MPDSLLFSMRATIARYRMFTPGSTVVVAVSGGQDSCALLHGLYTLNSELGLNLQVAHLNHGFRGAEADADAEFVRAFAEGLGLSSSIEKRDVPGAKRLLHASNQDAARTVRHQFLQRVAVEVGAETIALGHTRDDRVETILLNILRGSGIEGLRGLAPVSENRVRPLLDVTREQTGAYCKLHGIAFREDVSNVSPAYTRNRIREELLPHLESYYNPGTRAAILRLSELAAEDSAVLHELSQEALERATLNISEGSIVLSIEVLKNLPPALTRRAVRHAIERVRGSLEDITFAAVQRASALIESPGSSFELPGTRTVISRRGDRLEISSHPLSVSRRPIVFELAVPGETSVAPWNVVFKVRRGEPTVSPAIAGNATRIILEEGAVKLPLTVRNRRPGDRFHPLGMPGTKKVQDLLVDHKIPAEMRDDVPIIEDAEGILWVVGHGVSERTRITSKQDKLLSLEACYGET